MFFVGQPTLGLNTFEGQSQTTPNKTSLREFITKDVRPIVGECYDQITDFQNRKITHSHTLARIYEKLVSVYPARDERLRAAFTSYITTLDSHDIEKEMAGKRRRAADLEQSHSPESDGNPDKDSGINSGLLISKKVRLNGKQFPWNIPQSQ
jgi:hypothetical protein